LTKKSGVGFQDRYAGPWDLCTVADGKADVDYIQDGVVKLVQSLRGGLHQLERETAAGKIIAASL